MSPDAHGGQLDNPQSLNRYAYVVNNPLRNIDPTGMDCVYLNDAGTGVETDKDGNQIGVDRDSSRGECMGDATHAGTGGYWVDGTANTLYIDPNSNQLALTGYENGQQTESQIYNSVASVTVTATDSAQIGIQDISLGANLNYFGGLHLVQQPSSPGYSFFGMIKAMFNCWSTDSPDAHIGPKPPGPKAPTDTVPNHAASLHSEGNSRQYGHVTGPELGNAEHAEGMGKAADAAAMLTDISGCIGNK